MRVAPIMRLFATIMAPLVWLLRASVNAVLKILPRLGGAAGGGDRR